MIYYLNFGFIVEQALVDIVKRYMDRQHFSNIYDNFKISVVNQHPFARMIIDQNAKVNDSFPAIIITSQSENKVNELINMPAQTMGVGYSSEDIEQLKNIGKRIKTKINENGEKVEVIKKGEEIKETLPGYLFVYDDIFLDKLKEIADSRTQGDTKGMVYGLKIVTRRQDKISVEIWSENNQLKNELYEQLRLLFISSLNYELKNEYALFNPIIVDKSINGERSANYNFDFDVILHGSHISFEIDYDIIQIILDSEINEINNNLIMEVIDNVKKQ